MKIALFIHEHKEQALVLAQQAALFLQPYAELVMRAPFHHTLGIPPLSLEEVPELDLMISFGGDGTILTLMHEYPLLQAPVLGVNVGRLGFMTHAAASQVNARLRAFLDHKGKIEERLMLQSTIGSSSCYAVNDIVFHRGNNPHLIELCVHVDGKYLNTFSADGVIVATPNGSTAYSLAAGGPILVPSLHALLLTPISPHTISNRPIVLVPKQLTIQNLSIHPLEVAFDGTQRSTLSKNEVLTISISPNTFKILLFEDSDYFQILRHKLHWVGQAQFGKD